MPTYDDIIPRLAYELRDEEAWPSDTSKLAEQLNLLYNAALAIGRSIPLGRLTLVESAALTGVLASGTGCNRYDLGEVDAFSDRYSKELGISDFGIASVRLEGVDYNMSLAIPVPSILTIAKQPFQQDQVYFALDFDNAQIYAMNVTELKLFHVPKFVVPATTTGAADSSDTLLFPIENDNDLQRVIHIVAAHVSGVTIKDPAGAQFQALLEQTYAA